MEDYKSLSKEELELLLVSLKKELKDTKDELEEARVQIRVLNERVDELVRKYESKTEVTNKLIFERFMPKSEKLDKSLMIDELEVVTSKTKRRSPYRKITEDLKKLQDIEEIIIDYDFDTKGIDKSKVKEFGYDESYKIEVEPINIKVKKIIRKKYKDKENIYEELSDDIFPHSPLTPSLAANIINTKYYLGIPFYKYASYLNSKEIRVSDTDIGNWTAKAIDRLNPLYDLLKEKLFNTAIHCIHIDETPLKVIDEKKKKCYMFVYTSTVWDSPIFIYDFNSTRKCDRTADFLIDYTGYIEVDGYSGYNILRNKGIKINRCLAHARRKFMDVLNSLSDEEKRASIALEVIQIITKLYKYEERFKEDRLKPSEIYKERNSKYYLDTIDELDSKINSIDISISPALKKAVTYYKNQRKELFTYLENGYLSIDNNRAEREAIRPFVTIRKNFLFCKSANGAEKTAKIFSIVQTARANGLKIEEYLKYAIENIDKIELEKLLPWHEDIPDDLRIHLEDIK